MIDSAIVLFPYYKHKLNSEDGKFVIETDKEFRSNSEFKIKNKAI